MSKLNIQQDTSLPQNEFLSRSLIASLNLDWEKAIYIAFILIAILTRFWGLGDRVMSHDESLHTQFSYQYYRGDGFSHTPLMHGPFLFHITALTYWLMGANDFTSRVPVAIFGVLLVVMPYFLRPWLGRIGALFTSFIFLISPYLMYYSRYIRHDIYVIVWAMIVFIATWYYLDKKEEKYLWWFVAGLSLMFATKEVAFIYVAIFGSFLVIRLLPQIGLAGWFPQVRGSLVRPILLALVGLILVGGSYLGQRVVQRAAETPAGTATATEPFAADPETDTAVTEVEPPSSSTETMFRWLQIGGIVLAAAGLFWAANGMRPFLDNLPEVDLIILYSTLILPMVSPILVTIAGWNPRDYTFANCLLDGQAELGGLQLTLARLASLSWWSCAAQGGLVRIAFFVVITLIVAVAVGLWWNGRRWLISAAIFYSIFLVLYTSVFTNPNGVTSGLVGSLGYWLEQQGVQRGSQPEFYYWFVVPFYEFLPLLFSILAVFLWFRVKRLNKVMGYWIGAFLLAWFSYRVINWWITGRINAVGEEINALPVASFLGLLVAGLIITVAILFWFLVRTRQIKAAYGMEQESLLRLFFQWDLVCDMVPYLAWWLLLTWWAYSYAGEKMPWLSTHFVIPMGLLSGWYFNEKLQNFDLRRLFNRDGLLYLGLTIVTVIALALALGPIILGTVQLGSQQLDNLRRIGRVLGGLIASGILIWLWFRLRERIGDGRARNVLWSLSIFIILAVLTIRFAFMAAFSNADYAREFMVYAHGAPAAKSVVLEQVAELSERLNGDNSIRVAYGGSGVAWPFTWYMRQFPNSFYFGENPGANLQESPLVIVGRSGWEQADNILGNNYESKTYTYLWWPMEDYRQISWNAILGDPATWNNGETTQVFEEGAAAPVEPQIGLRDPDRRQAIWDIWFYRDFEKYDQTFNKTHTAGQWPLRDELRLYMRKDVLSQLWDFGISPVSFAPEVELYAEGDLAISPSLTLHSPGFPGAGPGEFSGPRNLAVDAQGNIYVLDSGNARVQVFDPAGELLTTWGGPGSGPGEFNPEGLGPWGIAVDDEFVYVADTWNHRVQKFTHEGEFVASFGQAGDISQMPDQGLGLFFGPRDIKLLGDGRMLVTDTGNHRLQIFDTNGNVLGQIGGNNGQFGSNLGFFYEPVGVAVANSGSLYVADTWNGRVQQFSPELFPVNEWPVPTWAESTSINNKPYAATDSAGRLYVTDPENFRVLIFTPNGDYLGKFGQFGTEPDAFAMPTGIFIDSQDNIYVADAGNNRIVKYPPIFAPAAVPVEEVEEEAVEEEAPIEPTATEGEEEEPAAADTPTPSPTAIETDTAVSPTPTVPE